MIRVITDMSLEDRPLQCVRNTPAYSLDRDKDGVARILLKEYAIELYGDEHIYVLAEAKAEGKISDDRFIQACLQIAFSYMINNNMLMDYLKFVNKQGQVEGQQILKAQLQSLILGGIHG